MSAATQNLLNAVNVFFRSMDKARNDKERFEACKALETVIGEALKEEPELLPMIKEVVSERRAELAEQKEELEERMAEVNKGLTAMNFIESVFDSADKANGDEDEEAEAEEEEGEEEDDAKDAAAAAMSAAADEATDALIAAMAVIDPKDGVAVRAAVDAFVASSKHASEKYGKTSAEACVAEARASQDPATMAAIHTLDSLFTDEKPTDEEINAAIDALWCKDQDDAVPSEALWNKDAVLKDVVEADGGVYVGFNTLRALADGEIDRPALVAASDELVSKVNKLDTEGQFDAARMFYNRITAASNRSPEFKDGISVMTKELVEGYKAKAEADPDDAHSAEMVVMFNRLDELFASGEPVTFETVMAIASSTQ